VAVVRPADLCEATFSRVLLVGVDPDVFPAPAAIDQRSRASARSGARPLSGACCRNRGPSRSLRLEALVAVLARYERALDRRGLYDDADRAREAVLAVSHGAARGVEASQRDFITVRTDDRAGSGPLAALRRAQLGGGVAAGAPVRLLEVGDAGDQARAAAGVVAGWLRAGVPPQEIIVACGDLDVHGPEVVAELAVLGVRARLRSGVVLSRTGPGRALIAALGLADRGFPREELAAAHGRARTHHPGRLREPQQHFTNRDTGLGLTRVSDHQRTLARQGVHATERRTAAVAVAEQAVREIEAHPERRGCRSASRCRRPVGLPTSRHVPLL
jgi:hypothetical protein